MRPQAGSGTGRAVGIRRPFTEAGSLKACACRAELVLIRSIRSARDARMRATAAGGRAAAVMGPAPCLKEIYIVTGSYYDTGIHTDRHGCGPSCARCLGANTIRVNPWRSTSDDKPKLGQPSA